MESGASSWTGVELPEKGADVTQSTAGKPEAAEERTEQTRSFVRRVRAATRRKYTPEEKIRVVLEGFRREVTVNGTWYLGVIGGRATMPDAFRMH